MQTNTRTLVYCVLIARYFPNSDFLHAELGRQPSYAWRSIMASTFRAVTLPNTLHIDSTVSELIDEATDAWKDALIKHIFLPTKAQTILSIPQSHRRTHDLLAHSQVQEIVAI